MSQVNELVDINPESGEVLEVQEGLSKEEFLSALPPEFRGRVSDDMVHGINEVLLDPMLRESFRDNLVSHTSVLTQGKYKLTDYVNAVKFVSLKLLGSSNVEAYMKTFPERYDRLIRENTPDKSIASFAANYNNNQLVNKIFSQTLVPFHILNADVYQKAINRQAHLMMNAVSEKVQSDAANSLLHHLKPPETQKVQLDINTREDESIKSLKETTMELVAQQKRLISSGVLSVENVAHSKLVREEEDD